MHFDFYLIKFFLKKYSNRKFNRLHFKKLIEIFKIYLKKPIFEFNFISKTEERWNKRLSINKIAFLNNVLFEEYLFNAYFFFKKINYGEKNYLNFQIKFPSFFQNTNVLKNKVFLKKSIGFLKSKKNSIKEINDKNEFSNFINFLKLNLVRLIFKKRKTLITKKLFIYKKNKVIINNVKKLKARTSIQTFNKKISNGKKKYRKFTVFEDLNLISTRREKILSKKKLPNFRRSPKIKRKKLIKIIFRSPQKKLKIGYKNKISFKKNGSPQKRLFEISLKIKNSKSFKLMRKSVFKKNENLKTDFENFPEINKSFLPKTNFQFKKKYKK